ncbi:hypothetical protein [Pseudoalteromonas ardens]|uniref:hypothetical protein n=1 Tax=Pseudoalteromonas ardens TaxID=3048490 RepID=UPI0012E2AC18|nr:hypothetical protein [Pseudoalteromonas sp. R96]MDK1310054.1 hypothetical protein [Pseudoalteromonas sp. R96]
MLKMFLLLISMMCSFVVAGYLLLSRKERNLATMTIIALAFLTGSTALVSWATVRREQGGGGVLKMFLLLISMMCSFAVAGHPFVFGGMGLNPAKMDITALGFVAG